MSWLFQNNQLIGDGEKKKKNWTELEASQQ